MNTIFKIIGLIQIVLFCYNVWYKIGPCFPEPDYPCVEPVVWQEQLFSRKEPGSLLSPVEEMPRFPGCEDFEVSKQELKSCADEKLLEFVYSNIRYPKSNSCAEGTVIVQFNIEKDGSISNPKIMRDIAPGFGKEVIRVVNLMPGWIPGKQSGKAVKTRFTLPVRIRFE